MHKWAVISILLGSVLAAAGQGPEYRDPKVPIERRVEDLLRRMTLQEKLGQLHTPAVYDVRLGKDIPSILATARRFAAGHFWAGFGAPGGLFAVSDTLFQGGPRRQALGMNELQKIVIEKTRLGIPILQTEEATHGTTAAGHTIFPEGPALGSTWNIDLIRNVYAAVAKEARAVGIHQLCTLVIEPVRDPRQGRNQEAFSEDPYFCARVAEAVVAGVQGADVSAPDKAVAVLCHFPGQTQPVGGQDLGAMEISERVLREVFLPPWVAGIKKAGALGVMATYPTIDGIPTHASEKLLTTILREELGFRGIVLSEGMGFATLLRERVAADDAAAGELAVSAGVDMGVSLENAFLEPLAQNVERGRVPVALIDRAVRRVLTAKFRLGLFDRPYVDAEAAARTVHSPEHRELALQAAREGCVLLKNEGGILPLRQDLKTIAVIGPNADHARNQLGDYVSRTVPQLVTTVLGGVRALVPPGTRVLYAKGCSVLGNDRSGFAEAVALARGAGAVIVVVGENERFSPEGGTDGEGRDVASLDLTGQQEELIKAVHATGTPTVVVLINGRPLSIRWAAKNVPAILEAWLPGEQGGRAVAEILFGRYNPSGRLSLTVPRHVGQLPMYYNQKPSRSRWSSGRREVRNYVDMSGAPLYPFGYGLSYTSFRYGNLRISPAAGPPDSEFQVTAEIRNTGTRSGEEVVQLYLQDVNSSVVRPLQELKGFRKVKLEAGGSATVSFRLTPEELSFLDRDLKPVVEPGLFRVLVASSSEDVRLQGTFKVR